MSELIRTSMGSRLLKIAAIYLLVGLFMGLGMAIAHDHAIAAVHAHINLLGWVTLAIVGLVYLLFPAAAETRLAKWHFWLHNLGLPVMMLGLLLIKLVSEQYEPIVAIGSIVVLLSLILFVINLFRQVK